MTFDIVIPTFNRLEKLVTCLNSIPKTNNIHIWVYFDNNDKTYHTFPINEKHITKVLMPKKYQAFGIWNYHAQKCISDIMVYLCDDTSLYLDTLLNVEKHFIELFPDTDGVVTFNQVNIKGTNSAMGCIGKKFMNRYPGYQLFNPNYVSFYADTDLGNYAKKLGKFYYGLDCRIEHFHPVSGVKPDSTHHIIRGKDKEIDIKINKIRTERQMLWPETTEMIPRE